MSITVILAIALVSAAAAAVNGLIGSAFLLVLWLWLYGGVLPSVSLYLKTTPTYTWAPHLLLPLIAFLVLWQLRLRGRIGPQVSLRELLRRRSSYA